MVKSMNPPVDKEPTIVSPSSKKSATVPKAVKDAYSQGKLAILVGSGLSLGKDVKGRFPTWRETGFRLIDYAVENDLLSNEKAERRRADIKEADTLTEYLDVLESVKTALGNHYRKALTGLFLPDDAAPGIAHRAICDLEVKALLTTNYDRLIEMTQPATRLSHTWQKSTEALQDLQSDRLVLFKIHGNIKDVESIVLTRREYDDINQNGSYRAVLRHLLAEHTFLFVGYGMEDPFDLDRILNSNQADFKHANREHFVLMRGASDRDKARYLKDFNVRVISIDNHDEIVPFLDAIGNGRPAGMPVRPTETIVTPMGPTRAELNDYLTKIESLYSSLPLAGFSTKLRVPIDLADLYVPLRAMMDLRAIGDARFADAKDAERCLKMDERQTELSLPDGFKECEERKRRGFVILGDPGAGKTTHLKRVVVACCRDGAASLGLPKDMIPVFLPLRELKDPGAGLAAFIQAQLDKNVELGTSADFGKKLIEQKNLLILLDGLDEVLNENDRGQVSKWINTALKSHPQCRFVVTCRYAGYSEGVRLDADFLELHIRPLSDEQVATFVHNWYRIVEQAISKDKTQAAAIAKKQANKLIERLRADFRGLKVYELTANPLLLANLCLVHRDRGELPRRRSQLYNECIDVLLERWRTAKDLPLQVTADEGRRVLQPAALFMHEKENRARISADELAPVIEPALRSIKWTKGGATEFLQTIRDESGLLTGWGDGTFGFMHLGFQEYLAAREIRMRALSGNTEIIPMLAAKFGESWWQEVTLLLLALEEPSLFEPLMREVIKNGSFTEHSELVEMCLDDAAQVSVKPFVELVQTETSDTIAQLQSLRILSRISPDEFKRLLHDLPKFTSREVRAWLAGRDVVLDRKIVYSERGNVELMRIPGGEFLMGSPNNEQGRYGDEDPQHKVRVADFYLGRYPVTNEQYAQFLKENPKAKKPEYWGDRQYNQPNQPVVGVSWDEARAYCDWAGLRLPSEAEWEYACRAGTTTRYWSGDTDTDLARVGWYSGNSNSRLHSVGEKEQNPFGLFDMHGNIREWMEDKWHGNYNGAPTDGSAWVDKKRAERRVIRGGSFDFGAANCRSARRPSWIPGNRSSNLGFRPARSIP
jgi:formylglycine-generating enzyme required for sulfatase activity